MTTEMALAAWAMFATVALLYVTLFRRFASWWATHATNNQVKILSREWCKDFYDRIRKLEEFYGRIRGLENALECTDAGARKARADNDYFEANIRDLLKHLDLQLCDKHEALEARLEAACEDGKAAGLKVLDKYEAMDSRLRQATADGETKWSHYNQELRIVQDDLGQARRAYEENAEEASSAQAARLRRLMERVEELERGRVLAICDRRPAVRKKQKAARESK